MEILLHRGNQQLEELAPFINNQQLINGRTTAYVCENFACHAPITQIDQLKQLLEK